MWESDGWSMVQNSSLHFLYIYPQVFLSVNSLKLGSVVSVGLKWSIPNNLEVADSFTDLFLKDLIMMESHLLKELTTVVLRRHDAIKQNRRILCFYQRTSDDRKKWGWGMGNANNLVLQSNNRCCYHVACELTRGLPIDAKAESWNDDAIPSFWNTKCFNSNEMINVTGWFHPVFADIQIFCGEGHFVRFRRYTNLFWNGHQDSWIAQLLAAMAQLLRITTMTTGSRTACDRS